MRFLHRCFVIWFITYTYTSGVSLLVLAHILHFVSTVLNLVSKQIPNTSIDITASLVLIIMLLRLPWSSFYLHFWVSVALQRLHQVRGCSSIKRWRGMSAAATWLSIAHAASRPLTLDLTVHCPPTCQFFFSIVPPWRLRGPPGRAARGGKRRRE